MTRTGAVDALAARVIVGTKTFGVYAGLSQFQVSGADPQFGGLVGTRVGYLTDFIYPTAPRGAFHTYGASDLGPETGWAGYSAGQVAAFNDVLARSMSAPSSTAGAAATQLAIWEIAKDFGNGPLSLGSGFFRATNLDGSPLSPEVSGLVQDLLASVGSGLRATQRVVGLAPPEGLPPAIIFIPLPASVFIGLAGLAGVGLIVVRRRTT